jgi:hypothetical protein
MTMKGLQQAGLQQRWLTIENTTILARSSSLHKNGMPLASGVGFINLFRHQE